MLFELAIEKKNDQRTVGQMVYSENRSTIDRRREDVCCTVWRCVALEHERHYPTKLYYFELSEVNSYPLIVLYYVRGRR